MKEKSNILVLRQAIGVLYILILTIHSSCPFPFLIYFVNFCWTLVNLCFGAIISASLAGSPLLNIELPGMKFMWTQFSLLEYWVKYKAIPAWETWEMHDSRWRHKSDLILRWDINHDSIHADASNPTKFLQGKKYRRRIKGAGSDSGSCSSLM